MLSDGNSHESIAAYHGLTLGAVKARFNRMRPLLREAVGVSTGTRLSRRPATPDLAERGTMFSELAAAYDATEVGANSGNFADTLMKPLLP